MQQAIYYYMTTMLRGKASLCHVNHAAAATLPFMKHKQAGNRHQILALLSTIKWFNQYWPTVDIPEPALLPVNILQSTDSFVSCQKSIPVMEEKHMKQQTEKRQYNNNYISYTYI